VRSFHESVDSLFEAIAPSLSEFKIYGNTKQYSKTEPELRDAAHRLMIGFVDICALSLEYAEQGKWHRFKATMKAVLLNDETIKAEIEKFRELAAAHHSLQATQTLKVVLESNDDLRKLLEEASESGLQIGKISKDVASLKDSDDQRKTDDVKGRNMENIQKKLQLGLSDQTKSPMQLSQELSEGRFKEAVPGTGSWLKDSDISREFQQWADINDNGGGPICALTGESGTGKSVLMSTIEHQLRDKYSSADSQPHKTLIASYFFPSLNNEKQGDSASARTALKCMAVQLAKQDDAYAKFASQTCNNKDSGFFRDANCQELWDTLGLGTLKGKSHYLIFDGLTEPTEDRRETRELITLFFKQASGRSSVRILLSLPSTNSLPQINASYLNINVALFNAVDIREHIKRELSKSTRFRILKFPSRVLDLRYIFSAR